MADLGKGLSSFLGGPLQPGSAPEGDSPEPEASDMEADGSMETLGKEVAEAFDTGDPGAIARSLAAFVREVK